ncbi:MAG: hypothetical protein ACOY4Q_01535 [Bacillota bacterium]
MGELPGTPVKGGFTIYCRPAAVWALPVGCVFPATCVLAGPIAIIGTGMIMGGTGIISGGTGIMAGGAGIIPGDIGIIMGCPGIIGIGAGTIAGGVGTGIGGMAVTAGGVGIIIGGTGMNIAAGNMEDCLLLLFCLIIPVHSFEMFFNIAVSRSAHGYDRK